MRSNLITGLLYAWLALSFVVTLHALGAGSGLAGPVLLWQLRHFQAVYPVETVMGMGVLVAGLPLAIIIVRDARRTRPPFTAERRLQQLKIMGALGVALPIVLITLVCRLLFLPGSSDPPVRVKVDDVQPEMRLDDVWATLSGMAQMRYRYQYDEVTLPKSGPEMRTRHSLTPVTPSSWDSHATVRFLVEDGLLGPGSRTRTRPTGGDERPLAFESRPGWLLAGEIPAYVRTDLASRGIEVSSDAMLLSSDREDAFTRRLVPAIIVGLMSLITALCFISTFARRPIAAAPPIRPAKAPSLPHG